MLRLLGASALTLLLGLNAARADLVVIAHPESGVDELDQTTLVNIFMGRYQKLPSGISAFPIDLQNQRESFYRLLVDKGLPEINSYWARLMFSGRASPPRQVPEPAEVVDIVANNRGAIGYINGGQVPDNVIVVHVLDAGAE
ncbi:ABC-type phosphate transport system substrate-binding protein [Litorivivens lipolytica]|uniref:ABC-type phosphate transport system substrate-binding protein n=1 Tax=Litorivivens lipolytica TaxID=1524264 RepID=A0A7W4W739_9GAMM|nr:hypothetical protein [Litorivivens lipolytica]MBB3048667.1 ABC-type phosphate transport system substrate-binding protein [Litorivivens lipolytica]